MLLAEQHDDEWAVGRNYFSAESMALIDAPRPTDRGNAAQPAHRQLITYRREDDANPLLHDELGLDYSGPRPLLRA